MKMVAHEICLSVCEELQLQTGSSTGILSVSVLQQVIFDPAVINSACFCLAKMPGITVEMRAGALNLTFPEDAFFKGLLSMNPFRTAK
jgi:hypothetical protein